MYFSFGQGFLEAKNTWCYNWFLSKERKLVAEDRAKRGKRQMQILVCIGSNKKGCPEAASILLVKFFSLFHTVIVVGKSLDTNT